MPEEPDLVTESVVADMLVVAVWTLQRWRQTGEGPPYFKVGRLVRYSRREVTRWLDDQRIAPR